MKSFVTGARHSAGTCSAPECDAASCGFGIDIGAGAGNDPNARFFGIIKEPVRIVSLYFPGRFLIYGNIPLDIMRSSLKIVRLGIWSMVSPEEVDTNRIEACSPQFLKDI